MKQNKENAKLQDFHNWMLKIKNVEYSDNEKAIKAYDRILGK